MMAGGFFGWVARLPWGTLIAPIAAHDCAAGRGTDAAQGDGGRDCPPSSAVVARTIDIGPPVVAPCSIGERHGGRLWDTVRWSNKRTLLVGPGVTLTLDAGDVGAIHSALGRVLLGPLPPAEASSDIIGMQADGL